MINKLNTILLKYQIMINQSNNTKIILKMVLIKTEQN